jgi:antitoxin MazE
MRATLRKMGNSQGVIIPKTVIAQLGFEGEVEMHITETGLVLEKPKKSHPREGWAEASKALANEELDHEWLDFPNAFDEEEWTWPTDES